MKLKYYLRGMGIGIIITVIVLAVASIGKKDGLTDEEIISRAEKLGMVKEERSGSILDKLQENEVDPSQENGDPLGEEDQPEENGSSDNGDRLEGDGTGTEPPSDGDVPVQEGNGADQQPADPGSGASRPDTQQPSTEFVSLRIGSGEYSDKISEKLLQLGLIDNAETFNKYLMESGIDNMISVGEYTIPGGASYEEIARILSGEPNP